MHKVTEKYVLFNYDMSSLSLILILDKMRKPSFKMQHITRMNSVLTSILFPLRQIYKYLKILSHEERLKYT